MATLSTILQQRLESLRPHPAEGWIAACPACRLAGHDKTRSHLRVYKSGAFVCAKHQGDTEHNKIIRSYIYDGIVATDLEAMSIIDPEPKLETDPVYPEDWLKTLVPDYSYWTNRGISEGVLRRLEGGLYPPGQHGKMEGRFTFPVRHHQTNRIMGWTGRLVNSASFGPVHKHLVKSSRCVYPLTVNKDAILRARRVVLLESIGDLLALMTAGIDCALVLFGLHLNSRVLGFLVGANLDQVVISTNNDAADPSKGHQEGNKAALKLRTKLAPYLGEDRVIIRLPITASDWGEVLERGTDELDVFKGELGL